MKAGYIDTSALVAIAFGEKGGSALAHRLEDFDEILSSNLLEAEFRSALARERVSGGDHILSWITWVLPGRPLSPEVDRVLAAGYLRGADLWHLACALYVVGLPEELGIVSVNERQRGVAEALGFEVVP